jgi:hypothetical protein
VTARERATAPFWSEPSSRRLVAVIGQIKLVGDRSEEATGDKLKVVFKFVWPKFGIELPIGEALIGELMIRPPLRT